MQEPQMQKSDVTPETVGADAEALMNFSDVNETVTAKQSTNLRNIPSQGSDAQLWQSCRMVRQRQEPA